MEKPKKIPKDVAPYVEYLEERVKKFESSPYVTSYISLLNQIDNWNKQLSDKPIDLFAESTDKSFDRAHKYFTEQTPYFEQLAYLRKQMSPEEKVEVEAVVRKKKERIAIAEKIAQNGRV